MQQEIEMQKQALNQQQQQQRKEWVEKEFGDKANAMDQWINEKNNNLNSLNSVGPSQQIDGCAVLEKQLGVGDSHQQTVEQIAAQAGQVGLTSNRYTNLTLNVLKEKLAKLKSDVDSLHKKANLNLQNQRSQLNNASLGSLQNNSSLGMPKNNSSLGMPQQQASLGMPQNNSSLGMPRQNSLLGMPQPSLGMPNQYQPSLGMPNQYPSPIVQPSLGMVNTYPQPSLGVVNQYPSPIITTTYQQPGFNAYPVAYQQPGFNAYPTVTTTTTYPPQPGFNQYPTVQYPPQGY